LSAAALNSCRGARRLTNSASEPGIVSVICTKTQSNMSLRIKAV
jgi:hypothetical protein